MKRALFGFAVAILFIGPPCLSQQPGSVVWQVRTPQRIIASPAVADDGTIYVAAGDIWLDSGGSICSFSPQGVTNWILNIGHSFGSSPSIGPDGRIYVGCSDGELRILTPSGSCSVFHSGARIYAAPAIAADGTVYIPVISNMFNKVLALAPDGNLRWTFSMTPLPMYSPPISYHSSSPAIGPDGMIYVGSEDGNLYAVRPDGTTNWVFPLTGITNSSAYDTYSSPAIGPDGTIYLGGQNGVIYAVDPSGVAKWKVQAGLNVDGSAAVGEDGTVYIGSLQPTGRFYALGSDGSVRWAFPTGGVSSSPALDRSGCIYVASYANSTLHAFTTGGTEWWSFTSQGGASDMAFASVALGRDGTIYFGAGKTLYALYGTNTLMESSWPMFRRNAKHTARSVQRGISHPHRLPDGTFAATLNVETGRTYRVEHSSNLRDWLELTNFISETCSSQVIDRDAKNKAQRFYRLGTGVP